MEFWAILEAFGELGTAAILMFIVVLQLPRIEKRIMSLEKKTRRG